MNEKLILFSGEMVRAILDGRKAMTRRVVKPKFLYAPTDDGWDVLWATGQLACPYGEVGDKLWVRETWAVPHRFDHMPPSAILDNPRVYYAASEDLGGLVKRPSIFMPRWACRLELEVTAVRVERLQDISDKDAVKEGCFNQSKLSPKEDYSFRGGFRALWDSLNAKRGYGWDSNPWVWVVEFKKVQHG